MIAKAIGVLAALTTFISGVSLAKPLHITVLDDLGTGVLSNVYYDDGTTPIPFKNTDKGGNLSLETVCAKIRTVKARPLDIGAYFESGLYTCAPSLTLRVLSRHTPIGVAVGHSAQRVTLNDGTVGVVIFKAALNTTVSDNPTSTPLCDVTLKMVIDQEVFRVTGDQWIKLDQDAVDIKKIPNVPKESANTISLPFKCTEAVARIDSLKDSATNEIARSFQIKEFVSTFWKSTNTDQVIAYQGVGIVGASQRAGTLTCSPGDNGIGILINRPTQDIACTFSPLGGSPLQLVGRLSDLNVDPISINPDSSFVWEVYGPVRDIDQKLIGTYAPMQTLVQVTVDLKTHGELIGGEHRTVILRPILNVPATFNSALGVIGLELRHSK